MPRTDHSRNQEFVPLTPPSGKRRRRRRAHTAVIRRRIIRRLLVAVAWTIHRLFPVVATSQSRSRRTVECCSQRDETCPRHAVAGDCLDNHCGRPTHSIYGSRVSCEDIDRNVEECTCGQCKFGSSKYSVTFMVHWAVP